MIRHKGAFTYGCVWEQCSLDDCDTSGPQERDCCNPKLNGYCWDSHCTKGQAGLWKSTVQPKSNTSSFLSLSHFTMGHCNKHMLCFIGMWHIDGHLYIDRLKSATRQCRRLRASVNFQVQT